MNYINKYFPPISKNLYSELKIDDVGKYSISTPKNADMVSKIIKQYFFDANIIITDAMAGVGGNTLSFSKYFYYVNSIEIENNRFNYLISNLNLYNKTNIICLNCNYLDIMFQIYQDVIFLDPPWGGREYKDFDEISIILDNKTLEEICNDIKTHKLCKMLILKLPLNYNINNFSDRLKDNMKIEYLTKMLIIMFFI